MGRDWSTSTDCARIGHCEITLVATIKNETAQIQPLIQRDQSGTGLASFKVTELGIPRMQIWRDFCHSVKMSPASVVVMASTECAGLFLREIYKS